MLHPRDIVAVFEDDPESGGTIGHYGTVIRIGTSAFSSPDDQMIRVLVKGREIDLPERDVLATGRIDDSNEWVNTSCSVQFEPCNDDDQQRGSYRSRAGTFSFVFRFSERPISTYKLRFQPITETERHGDLEYNAASDATLDRAYVLRAIGAITGELALPGDDVSNNTQPPQVFAPLAKAAQLLFGRFVPACFALAGALFLVTGIVELNSGWTSEQWPSVAGTIVSSGVRAVSRRDSDGHSDTYYRVNIRYTYDVLDEEYVGSQIRFGAMGHNERSMATQEKRRYPPGKRVKVFYDPKKPSNAILIQGAGGGVWVSIGLGSVFVVMGTCLFLYLPRVMAKTLTPAKSNRSS